MKYLLDTHVVLWLAENSPLLSDKAKTLILDINTEKYVSIASAWEIAIKLGNRKLQLDGGLPEFFRMIDDNGFFTLPVAREYLRLVPNLSEHHKDPFDRLLIATAMTEDMTLITIDENIQKYDLPWLW
ncbi:MAG: type II toxin-antitoxin system VapC family toxin [Treponema sp.]|nr:type II toxin-antitoxin system VapC family toxin [Treponema sp.]